MIYQPTNANPNNSVIDASVINTFEWIFNGGELEQIDIYIYYLNTDMLVYHSGKKNFSTFNNSLVTLDIPSNTLSNGNEYYWKIIEYQPYKADSNPADIFIISGNFVRINSSTSFVLSVKRSVVESGMYLTDINGKQAKILSYNSNTGECVIDSSVSLSGLTVGGSFTIYSSFLTTNNGFYFKTKDTPIVKPTPFFPWQVDDNGNVNSRTVSVIFTYTQKYRTPILYYRCDLYTINDLNTIIDSSGDIYTERLSYDFDGLISGIQYKVIITVVNQDGITITSDNVFNVLYNTPVTVIKPKVEYDDVFNAVKIYYNSSFMYEPIINGEYELNPETNLVIKSGDISYRINNEDDYTVITQFTVDSDKLNNIISINSDSDDYNNVSIELHRKNPLYTKLALQYSPNVEPDTEYVWGDQIWETTKDLQYYIMDTPIFNKWWLHNVRYNSIEQTSEIDKYISNIESLLQDSNVTKDDTSYVWDDDSIWNISQDNQFYLIGEQTSKTYRLIMTKNFVILQSEDGKIVKNVINSNVMLYTITLYSQCTFKYLDIISEEWSDDLINNYLNTPFIFVPEWDSYQNNIFNILYTDTLAVSSIQGTTSAASYYEIYRRNLSSNILSYVGKGEISEEKHHNDYIYDFMVASNFQYEWVIFPYFEKTMSTAISTDKLFIRFDEWCVNFLNEKINLNINNIEPNTTNFSNYYTDNTWKFGLNLEEDSKTQNLLKTKLDTINAYPKFSIQNRNYVSGGIKSYLTTMSKNNVYNNKNIIDNFPEYSPFRINSCIYNEPVSILEDWYDEVSSGKPVLIRDIKGNMWIGQIDSTTTNVDNYMQSSPTTISWTFVENSDISKSSVTYSGE